ncbi:hypothetical protein [Microbispora sp. CA-102843]|uniref:hypothetical protein n=1 Tax=Microbispora sp. CA-102843 TaxID=3239952 RepID=UPI003D8CD5FA
MLCSSRASRADNCSRSSGDSSARSDSNPRMWSSTLRSSTTMRDGRIAESWLHSRDQYEVDAFWGE